MQVCFLKAIVGAVLSEFCILCERIHFDKLFIMVVGRSVDSGGNLIQ